MGQNNVMHDVIHDAPKAGRPGRGFGHRGGSRFRRNWLAWRSASWLRIRFGPLALAVLLAAPLGPSWADGEVAAAAAEVAAAAAAVASEIAQKQKLRALFPDRTANGQATPPVIPQLE